MGKLLHDAINEFWRYKTVDTKQETGKGYVSVLRQFALYMRNADIGEISITNILDYLHLCKELGWHHNSFIPKCSALRSFFKYFYLQGETGVHPDLIPLPKMEYKSPNIAQKEHFTKLRKIIPKNTKDPRHIRNLALVDMLWDTGARIGEILSLDACDIDSHDRRAIIPTEKSRGMRPIREIFWTRRTNESICKWLEKRDALKERIGFEHDALFVSTTGVKVGKRLKKSGSAEALRRLSKKAGIPTMNAHSFRHRKGRHIIESGGSSADVMNILGHSTLASSTPYVRMRDKELERRARKFID